MATDAEGLSFKIWELVCCCFISIVGIISNSLVCFIFIRKGPDFRAAPFNKYLMALAIVDLLVSILTVPFYLILSGKVPHPSGLNGIIMCKVSHALPFWLAGASIYLLVVISFERYEALSNPLSAFTNRKSKTAAYVALAAAAGLVPQLPTIIGISYSKEKAQVGQCNYRWDEMARKVIYPIAFTIQYGIPAAVFIINFFRIRKCLAGLDYTLYHSMSNERARIKLMRRKRRTVKIMLLVTLSFLICWTPDHVLYCMYQFNGPKGVAWNSDLYQGALILGFASSCINPLLYAFQSKEFRENCRDVFSSIWPKQRAPRAFRRGPTRNFYPNDKTDKIKLIV